ncbi:hypothetical protein J6590_043686 [Homalodisca vitripennis]|nr:hypothetical protein J6590_043686 [Homalodisca vitripennis]
MGRGDMMVTSTPSPGSENNYHPMPQKYHGGSGSGGRRIPPEVPKRTSSISLRSLDHPSPAALTKTSDSGSLSSVQSSGSDSSNVALIPPPNTTWNKKTQSGSPEHHQTMKEPTMSMTQGFPHDQHNFYKVSEMVCKRLYRVGLNLFNNSLNLFNKKSANL